MYNAILTHRFVDKKLYRYVAFSKCTTTSSPHKSHCAVSLCAFHTLCNHLAKYKKIAQRETSTNSNFTLCEFS